jgi:hypothetical protein
MVPEAGQIVILERDGEQRRGLVDEKTQDGSFVVFWLDEQGQRLDPWWSVFDSSGEPLNGNWRLVAPEGT